MNKVKADCPCTKVNCERHGNCERCKEYHESSSYEVYCKRNKNKTVDINRKELKLHE